VLDGDYELIVFRFKADFLRECTQTLSSHGARDVKCVDVREGSIIVDVGASKAAVDAAVAEVVANGLDLPSFEKLTVQGMTEGIVRSEFAFRACVRMLSLRFSVEFIPMCTVPQTSAHIRLMT